MGLANLNPAKSWMVGVAAVVVKITSILRPIGITHHARLSDPIGPFLGFEIEEQQLCRIQGKRCQMLTVGRPAWAKKTFRTRERWRPDE